MGPCIGSVQKRTRIKNMPFFTLTKKFFLDNPIVANFQRVLVESFLHVISRCNVHERCPTRNQSHRR